MNALLKGIVLRTGEHGAGAVRRAAMALCAAMTLTLASALCAAGSPVLAESRFALVIGNAGYKSERLANPSNDAELIAKTLSGLGFKVTKLIDADQLTMKRAMIRFSRRLRGSDSVGLFYYAGHGVQVDGQNYLIPVGANIRDETEVPVEGLSLNQLFKTMERSPSRINIAILDACRNNPFGSRTRGSAGGLAPVQAPAGSFIAYATAPGEIAFDGDNGHSPYTAALTKAMVVPGIAIEEVFKRTRRKVLGLTSGRQTPWESSSLIGTFYFKHRTGEPEANARGAGVAGSGLTPGQLAEIKAWRQIEASSTAADYRRFAKAFPAGIFAEVGAMRIARLTAARPPGEPPPGPDGPVSRDGEALLEQAVKAGSERDFAEAARLYRAAAGKGLPAAMHALAKLYDQGLGVPRSLARAAFWFRKAAEKMYAPSMNALGNMHEFGEGAPKNLAAALRYYRLAAEAGDGGGMTSLAFLYATGKGAVRDFARARKWYLAASEKGRSRAMFNLALMQIRGEGGRIDFDGAAHWLGQAVLKDHAGAMRQLAAFHEDGRGGVARDPARAAELLLRAFEAGNKDAFSDLMRRPETWSRATRARIQRILRRRGLFRGRDNGVFGSRTRDALRSALNGSG